MIINKYFGTIIINTDSIGNIVWQKKINNLTVSSTISDMTYVGNGNYVGIVSYVYDNTNLKLALDVFKINIITQQLIWQKKYKLFKGIESISLHKAMGVEVLSNGSLIISGTADVYGLDAVILKLNSNGDSLWCKSYDFHPDPYDCQLNDLIVCDDGGFMGVGFWSDQSGPGWTAWMFKTDANGTIGFENPKFESLKFEVFPNPATDYTNIKFGNNLSKKASIKVYNSLGQLVFQDKIAKGEQTYKLDLKAFEIGVYFFEVVGEDGVLGSGRFVRE